MRRVWAVVTLLSLAGLIAVTWVVPVPQPLWFRLWASGTMASGAAWYVWGRRSDLDGGE